MIRAATSPTAGLKNSEKTKNMIPNTAKVRETRDAQFFPFHTPKAEMNSITVKRSRTITTRDNLTENNLILGATSLKPKPTAVEANIPKRNSSARMACKATSKVILLGRCRVDNLANPTYFFCCPARACLIFSANAFFSASSLADIHCSLR